MKIEVEDGGLVLKEVFSGILMETEEGNQIGICMRDDTFEINVIPKGSKERNWHHVDMQTASIQKDAPRPEADSDGLTDGEEMKKIVADLDKQIDASVEHERKRVPITWER